MVVVDAVYMVKNHDKRLALPKWRIVAKCALIRKEIVLHHLLLNGPRVHSRVFYHADFDRYRRQPMTRLSEICSSAQRDVRIIDIFLMQTLLECSIIPSFVFQAIVRQYFSQRR